MSEQIQDQLFNSNREVCVIGLSGYAGSGKDEAARQMQPAGWVRLAFADPVREGLLALNPVVPCVVDSGKLRGHPFTVYNNIPLTELVAGNGWDGAKRRSPHVRVLLQRFGTEAGRDIHGPDCWVNIWSRQARDILSAGGKVVATDVRFPNEVAQIRQLGGMVVRIERPGVGPANDHVSESLVDCDVVVANDGFREILGQRVLDEVAAWCRGDLNTDYARASQ